MASSSRARANGGGVAAEREPVAAPPPQSDAPPRSALVDQLDALAAEPFAGDNEWGIPDLRRDMLATMPSDTVTWIGDGVTPEAAAYVWHVGTTGSHRELMWDRTFVSLLDDDQRVEAWWGAPSDRLIDLVEMRYAIVPQWRLEPTDVRANSIGYHHHAQWLGRFLQEAGVMVVPSIRIPVADPDWLPYELIGVPKDAPTVVACVSAKDRDWRADPSLVERYAAIIDRAATLLSAQSFMLYGSGMASQIAQKVDRVTGVIEPYAVAKARVVAGRR